MMDDDMLWEETKPEVFSSHYTDIKVEFNENIDLFKKIIAKDHNYCKPVVKIERDELDNSDFFTDEEETYFEEIKDEIDTMSTSVSNDDFMASPIIDNYESGDNSSDIAGNYKITTTKENTYPTTSSKNKIEMSHKPITTKNKNFKPKIRNSKKFIKANNTNVSTINKTEENILNNTIKSLNEPNIANTPKTTSEAFNDNTQNHCMDQQYECYHCSAKFLQKKSLKLHLEAHAGIQHQCNICKAFFTQKGNLKVHMLTHAGKKRFSCIDCKMKFSRKECLMNHISKNKENSPFPCTHCDEIFTMKCLLMKHIITHKKTHRCMECQKEFPAKSLLNKHMDVHAQQKNFKCKTCTARFFQEASLFLHVNTHHIQNNTMTINKITKTSEKRLETKDLFDCTECNKVFTLKSSLVLHMMKHSMDDFICCKLCKNKHKPIMENLENTQSGNNYEDSDIVCKDCDTTFTRRECHEAHVTKNAGESQLTCRHCAAVFTKKCALAVHYRQHRKRRVRAADKV